MNIGDQLRQEAKNVCFNNIIEELKEAIKRGKHGMYCIFNGNSFVPDEYTRRRLVQEGLYVYIGGSHAYVSIFPVELTGLKKGLHWICFNDMIEPGSE